MQIDQPQGPPLTSRVLDKLNVLNVEDYQWWLCQAHSFNRDDHMLAEPDI